MKITLVCCPLLFKRTPLIGVAYIASSLKAAGHDVTVRDLNVEGDSAFDEREDLWSDEKFVTRFCMENRGLLDKWVESIIADSPGMIGFTLWNTNRYISCMLAGMIRERAPRLKIVFGGPDVLCSWDYISSGSADIFVKGEGEAVISEIADNISRTGEPGNVRGAVIRKGGALVDFGLRKEIAELDTLSYPDYSFFRLEKYHLKGILPISFNRGCKRACVFCNIHNDWKQYRFRKAERIYEEMLYQRGKHPQTKHFEIDSSSFTQCICELDRLCDIIIADSGDITWGGQATFEEGLTGKLINKMARAGCRSLGFGLESGSQKIIDRMGKKFSVTTAERIIRVAYECGIEVSCGIIIGFPGETEEDFHMTLDFLKRNKGYITFIGRPSELSLLSGSIISRRPEEFGITGSPYGDIWDDGILNHRKRTGRIKTFYEFLISEGIERAHPFERVQGLSGEESAEPAGPGLPL